MWGKKWRSGYRNRTQAPVTLTVLAQATVVVDTAVTVTVAAGLNWRGVATPPTPPTPPTAPTPPASAPPAHGSRNSSDGTHWIAGEAITFFFIWKISEFWNEIPVVTCRLDGCAITRAGLQRRRATSSRLGPGHPLSFCLSFFLFFSFFLSFSLSLSLATGRALENGTPPYRTDFFFLLLLLLPLLLLLLLLGVPFFLAEVGFVPNSFVTFDEHEPGRFDRVWRSQWIEIFWNEWMKTRYNLKKKTSITRKTRTKPSKTRRMYQFLGLLLEYNKRQIELDSMIYDYLFIFLFYSLTNSVTYSIVMAFIFCYKVDSLGRIYFPADRWWSLFGRFSVDQWRTAIGHGPRKRCERGLMKTWSRQKKKTTKTKAKVKPTTSEREPSISGASDPLAKKRRRADH